MPDPTHAEQMVAKLEQMLLDCAGLQSINVDGQQVAYRDLNADLQHWKKEVAKEQGKRARIRTINLG